MDKKYLLCERNAVLERKWKTIMFSFLEKILQKIYKNPIFVTFCDDVINGDVI